LPNATLPSIAIGIDTPFAEELALRLRRSRPPIIGRIEEQRLLLDLRTIAPPQDRTVLAALTSIEG